MAAACLGAVIFGLLLVVELNTLRTVRSTVYPPHSGYAPFSIIDDYVWSPDGQRVAFKQGGYVAGQRHTDWYWIDAAGGPVHPGPLSEDAGLPYLEDYKLIFPAGQAHPPDLPQRAYFLSWNADRSQGILVGSDCATCFPLVNAMYVLTRSGSFSRLPETFPDVDRPVWSPDGAAVAFSALGDDNFTNLYRMDLPANRMTHLSRLKEVAIADILWSPDGAWIAFSTQKSEGDEGTAWLIPATGGDPQVLVQEFGYRDLLGWSPDGQEILVEADGYGLEWMNVTHHSTRQVLAAYTSWSEAQVLQDGSISFIRTGDMSDITWLYQLNADGSGLRRVYPTVAIDRLACPGWITKGGQGQVTLSLSNSALAGEPSEVVLTVYDPIRPANSTAPAPLLAESLTLAPGQVVERSWVFPSSHDRFAVAAQVGVSEMHCLPRNWPAVLATLAAIGVASVLVLPWMMHRKYPLLWGLLLLLVSWLAACLAWMTWVWIL